MNPELYHIVQQYLRNIGAQNDSNYSLENGHFIKSIADVETAIKEDQLDQVIEMVQKMLKDIPNKEPLQVVLFDLIELKVYNFLSKGDQKAALEVLRNELTPMQCSSPHRIHSLALNILSMKAPDSDDKEVMIERILNALKSIPGLLRSDNRLLELVSQAKQWQVLTCSHHHYGRLTSDQSLWIDHNCGNTGDNCRSPEKELIWSNPKKIPTSLFMFEGEEHIILGLDRNELHIVSPLDPESLPSPFFSVKELWPKYWKPTNKRDILSSIRGFLNKMKVNTTSICALGIMNSQGLFVISDEADQITSLWDFRAEKLLHSWIRMRCYHILTPEDPNAKYFLALTDADAILQICTESFFILKTMPIIDPSSGIASAFVDGKRLLVSMTNSIIYYYDNWEDYPRPTKIFTGHQCGKLRTRAILSRYDPNILLSGSEDGSVYLWNINSGRLIYRLAIHENAVMDLIEVAENEFISSGFEGECFKWSIP